MYLITPAYTVRLCRLSPRFSLQAAACRRCGDQQHDAQALRMSLPRCHWNHHPLSNPPQEGALNDVTDECTKRARFLPPGVVLRLMAQVAEGLEARDGV